MDENDDTPGGDAVAAVVAEEQTSTRDAAQRGERNRIRRATLIFSGATMLSRFAGLAREIVTAALIGATNVGSAFTIANQIPNLLRSLVADSALSAAFVPVFTELREKGEEDRAWRVAGTVCSAILLVLGPLTVLAMIAAPWIVGPFVDRTLSAEDVDLAIGLTRILLPIVLILSLSGVIVGILNSHDRFGAAALAPLAWNGVILAGLAGAAAFGPRSSYVWVLASATLVGTLVQAVLPIPWMRGLGRRLTLRGAWHDPKVRQIFILMVPITVSLGLINVQQVLSAVFAANVDASNLVAGLEPGAGPAMLDKAFRVYMLPQGIFSVAVSSVFFPVLARMAAREDHEGFASTVDQGLRQILVLLVPSSVFLGVFAVPVVQVLYQRGEFDAAQTTGVALALIGFAIGLTFNGLSLLLIRSFFSLRNTWMPSAISALTLLVNVVVAWLSYREFGVLGIAAATSVANVVGVVLLYRLLAARTVGLGTGRTVWVGVGTLLASAVSVAVAGVVFLGLREVWGMNSFFTLLGVAAALGVMAPIYLALGARLGVVPRDVVRMLLRRGGTA